MKKASKNFTYAAGKRRMASARVRLFKGKGDTLVNDKPIKEYFSDVVGGDLWSQPFEVSVAMENYYAHVRVIGGGKKGQFEAVLHGIAKALGTLDTNNKLPLRKQGLLTRDARIRERRKVGKGGKARRAKQSPKR